MSDICNLHTCPMDQNTFINKYIDVLVLDLDQKIT